MLSIIIKIITTATAAKSLQSCPTLRDPWDPWSGLPFPSPMHESEK